MAYSRDYPNSIIPKGSKVVECLQNDDKELKRILSILSDIGLMSLFGSKRQCVLHAATGTDGKPSYITANGLNVVIDGSTTPVIVTFAGGYNANGTVDKTDTIVDMVNAWTMPANGTYYLYIDKDMSTGILSYGYTTIPDTYKTTAPKSPTLDQCYFNTVDMKMYHYNSSAWEQKLRVFVAKAVTTDSAATLTMYPFTSRATPSNLVQYDSDGNLQVVDNAGALAQLTASKFIGAVSTLATPRTIALSGKATGTATSFDGSGNIAIPVTAVTADSCEGNSATANKWATARTLTLTGNTTGSASIDGSGDVSIATTTSYATSAGTANTATKLGDENGGHFIVVDNTTNNSWSILGDNPSWWLKSIRTTFTTPAWLIDNYSAGIAFGGLDTKGVMTVAYSEPRFMIAGGNGTAPTWWMNLVGSNTESYNLDCMPKASYADSSGNSDTVDGWHAKSILDRINAINTGGIVAAGLDTNGYVKFATGLIIQWGTGTWDRTDTTINFPIAFSYVCNIVLTQMEYDSDWNSNYSTNRTLTSFNFHKHPTSATTNSWIAIGH